MAPAGLGVLVALLLLHTQAGYTQAEAAGTCSTAEMRRAVLERELAALECDSYICGTFKYENCYYLHQAQWPGHNMGYSACVYLYHTEQCEANYDSVSCRYRSLGMGNNINF